MSKIRKISETFLIIPRGFFWLFFGHGRRKISKVWWTYKFGGLKLCRELAVAKFGNVNSAYDYNRNQLSSNQSDFLIKRFKEKPLISIITPVYKVNTEWLDKCINSVIGQYYKNWELILVDDASRRKDITRLLKRYASRDSRIRIFTLEQNSGIVGATNFGLKEAHGDFIGFLDHDDELTPDALTWMLWALNKNPSALWFYSDEDKISKDTKFHSPYFKPDFSPEFLLSNMFTCHFSVYSSEIIKKVNGLRNGFDGSQDHDLALRISEIVSSDKIIHIPRVLYHWRQIEGSTASSSQAKPAAALAGRKAVQEALERRNLKASVTSNKICQTIYQIEFMPKSFPNVTIIIPTKNSLSLVNNCLESVRKHTEYPNYKIVIIDNQSYDIELLEYLKEKESEDVLNVMKYDNHFNHSEMNNLAVKSVDSEFIVFMNNDIEIISDHWLEQLVATINIDKSVASVGCLLLFKDMTVQHGGIILGLNSVAGHAHRDIPAESGGYFGRLITLQEMSGVTAALSIMRRSAFESVGGFNSERYPTSFNDVDLAIRLRKKGYRFLYNPMVQAFHYESKTRPVGQEEITYRQNIRDDYLDIINNDPFYNPNLPLGNEQFSGFRPFPVEDQISELKDILL
jgi:O-antigen biosynthesis protein